MTASQPLKRPSQSPIGLHDRAIENIHFIRRTMESSASFTSVPGWGGVLMGVIAIPTAFVASRITDPGSWLATWLIGGLVAFGVGAAMLFSKARSSGVQLSRGVGRKFLSSLSPALVAAAVLTVVLFRSDVSELIPGVWLLLYGAAVVAGGAHSIRVVPTMGLCFMVLGVAALLGPRGLSDLLLGIGFGGLHVIFGLIIARRHGG